MFTHCLCHTLSVERAEQERGADQVQLEVVGTDLQLEMEVGHGDEDCTRLQDQKIIIHLDILSSLFLIPRTDTALRDFRAFLSA